MVSPWMTETSEDGTPIARCIASAPVSRNPKKSAGRQDGEGIERAQQRDGDGVESEAVREALDEPVVDPEHLDAAGEAGERARQRHDREHRARLEMPA